MKNTNFQQIENNGHNLEYKSQRNGQGRIYLTIGNSRVFIDGKPVFKNYYDNKGRTKDFVNTREGSHLWYATQELLKISNTLTGKAEAQ